MKTIRITDEQLKDDPEVQLKNFRRNKKFLVAVDTDGCITDNMNGKQMLIFHPQFMEFYNLWGIESYYRECAEYYNLFSIHRGCNRFVAVSLTLKALDRRRDVRKILEEKNIGLPNVDMIDGYIDYCSKNKLGLGNPGLKKYIDENPTDFSLYKLLGWSEAVNRTFPYISVKIPVFENVRESLKLISEYADIIVVSKTPYTDLVNYWERQKIDNYVQVIAGQEMGSKRHHIKSAKDNGGYSDDEILMIGDGNGDLKAAKGNDALFYPIIPGSEQYGWNSFPSAFNEFIKKQYKGEFENSLLQEFKKALLDIPAWEEPDYNHIKAYREKQDIRKELYLKFNPSGRLFIL
jgi:hypothetical protein